MAKQELYRELYILTRSALNSIAILFRMYGPILNTILLVLIAYAAFKIGRKTVVDPLEEDVKRIRNILENRANYTVHLPKQIDKISKIRKVSLAIFAAGTLVFLYLVYIRVKFLKKVGKVIFVQIGLFLAVAILLLWAYELLLRK